MAALALCSAAALQCSCPAHAARGPHSSRLQHAGCAAQLSEGTHTRTHIHSSLADVLQCLGISAGVWRLPTVLAISVAGHPVGSNNSSDSGPCGRAL